MARAIFIPVILITLSFLLFLGCVIPGIPQKPVAVNQTLPPPLPNATPPNPNPNSPPDLSANGSAPSNDSGVGTPTNLTAPLNTSPADNASNHSTSPTLNTTPPQPAADQFNTSGSALIDKSGDVYRTRLCSVTVAPSQLYAGQEAFVHLYAFSNTERITYSCGDDGERYQGTSGLFDDSRICRFSTPGSTQVWVALDGRICASAPIEVLQYGFNDAAPASCVVLDNTQTHTNSNGLRAYQAKVQFKNYPANTALTWDCRWRKFSKPLSAFTNTSSVSGTLTVNCQYTFDPGPISSLPVYAGAEYCGDLLAAN